MKHTGITDTTSGKLQGLLVRFVECEKPYRSKRTAGNFLGV